MNKVSTPKPKPYTLPTRWKISGTLTTLSPLHIGSGDTMHHTQLCNEKDNNKPIEVAAIVRGMNGPIIPATAIKGVLRAWAKRNYPAREDEINRIFGTMQGSGRAEFRAATIVPPDQEQLAKFKAHLPYWRDEQWTGIISHVRIQRQTGAAEDAHLYFEEFIPEGVSFQVEIEAERLTDADIQLLLAVLQQGAADTDHAMQFGANGADGWGRMTWNLTGVTKSDCNLKFDAAAGAFQHNWTRQTLTPIEAPEAKVRADSFELVLKFNGPFLVNDTSRTHCKENDGLPHFTPLKRADCRVWLPASSFRGAFRSRFEFLANSLHEENVAKRIIESVFGATSHMARFRLTEFTEVGKCKIGDQDFVAIDRFTGGAAEGAKFDAKYADRPTFKTRVTIQHGLATKELQLLAATFRDLENGTICFGFGTAKGYGDAKGTLDDAGKAWVTSNLVKADEELRGNDADILTTKLDVQIFSSVVSASAAIVGKLIFQSTKDGPKRRIVYVKKDGSWTTVPTPFDEKHLDPVLVGRKESEIPIHFDWEAPNKPCDIRPEGQPRRVTATDAKSRFYNPYYFLTMKERGTFPESLKDALPVNHNQYKFNCYSGRLQIVLKTKTPLLLCAPPTLTQDSHKIYPVLQQDGKPLLASSSVRGMLRSAYEAITNSRFGVFPFRLSDGRAIHEQHARRIGFRLPARSGLDRIPVRIVQNCGQLEAELLPGTSTFDRKGELIHGPVFAAWLGQYAENVVTLPNRIKPNHRQEVWAYLAPYHYSKTIQGRRPTAFDFWNVESIVIASLTQPTTIPTGRCSSRFAVRKNWARPGWYRGYICITLNNMTNKHDERFFFTDTHLPKIPLTHDNINQWADLIRDYQDQHCRQVDAGDLRPSILKAPKVFSRQISVVQRVLNTAEVQLREGDLCYAQIAENLEGKLVITDLFPVTISRKLYEKSPLDLLPSSLRPATSMAQLSPADRVFGWVSQDSATGENPAYRSQVRVGPVNCCTEGAIDKKPITLGILGQPKPAQGRFYLSKADGTTQPRGRNKEESGYHTGNRIRGPKVYPHHALGVVPENAETQEKSNQNRTVEGSVKPDTEFEFTLHFTNLSAVELGGLLWLLSLPEDHFLRLGLGKPLGFGSVHARIEKAVIADGSEWTKCIGTGQEPASSPIQEFVVQFEKAIRAANSTVLAAFKKTAKGFGAMPIHYPRLPEQPAGAGEHFEWFVANERGGRHVLPSLEDTASPTLPLDPR